MNVFIFILNSLVGRPSFYQGFDVDYQGRNCILTSIYYKQNYVFFKNDRIEEVTPELKKLRRKEAWEEFRKVKDAENGLITRLTKRRQRPPNLPKYVPPKIVPPNILNKKT